MNARRRETGSITPFALIFAIALLLLAGLVIDGGRQLNARGRALAYAQEAARAGAQAVDLDRRSQTKLVTDNALAIASNYCAQASRWTAS